MNSGSSLLDCGDSGGLWGGMEEIEERTAWGTGVPRMGRGPLTRVLQGRPHSTAADLGNKEGSHAINSSAAQDQQRLSLGRSPLGSRLPYGLGSLSPGGVALHVSCLRRTKEAEQGLRSLPAGRAQTGSGCGSVAAGCMD